jgi:DNA polymerase-3 subunit alpha
MPQVAPWTKIEQLKNEKDVTGFYMSGHPLEDFKMEIDQFCNVTITELKNNKEKYKNKHVAFAGILTAVNHRTSKTGNPFATFTMEDFTDFDNYILFSEDYLKMKHFLLEGSSLLIRAQITERKFKNGQLDIRITGITLLSEALERNTNEILLKLPLMSINEELIKTIEKVSQQSKGNCKLKFHVSDSESKTEITMPASKHTVASAVFLKEIEKFEGIQFKLS